MIVLVVACQLALVTVAVVAHNLIAVDGHPLQGTPLQQINNLAKVGPVFLPSVAMACESEKSPSIKTHVRSPAHGDELDDIGWEALAEIGPRAVLDHVVHNRANVCVAKRQLLAEQLVHDHRKRVHVRLGADWVTVNVHVCMCGWCEWLTFIVTGSPFMTSGDIHRYVPETPTLDTRLPWCDMPKSHILDVSAAYGSARLCCPLQSSVSNMLGLFRSRWRIELSV